MSERSVSKQKQEKRWYTVMAPEMFDRAELGETPADEPEQVYDRTIETTLGELQNDPSENNTKLTFQITDVGSDTAYTDFIKHELTRDYLRSLTRRGTSKVDAFVTVLTTDDYRVQVQPVAYTTKSADHSQERAVRKTMVDLRGAHRQYRRGTTLLCDLQRSEDDLSASPRRDPEDPPRGQTRGSRRRGSGDRRRRRGSLTSSPR